MPNFTDVFVQKLPEGLHFDTKLPNFGIRVGKNRKTWMVVKGANRTKVSIGHYPDISLAEARRMAKETLIAPTWVKPRISFPDALQTFLALPGRRPGTVAVMRSTLKPFKWTKQVHSITHEDVVRVLEAIEKPSARFHAQKDIKTFFNWLVPRYIDVSPCVGLKTETQPTRDRVLTLDEVKAVWSYDDEPYASILKLCLLTGQRVGEVTKFNADWIHENTVTIPAAIAKNGRKHTFPFHLLTAKYLLQYLTRTRNCSSLSRAKRNFDAAIPLPHFTVHDLRRSFATIHASIGTPPHITETLLNHKSGTLGGIAAVYNQYTYLTEMRTAALNYETYIATLVDARA